MWASSAPCGQTGGFGWKSPHPRAKQTLSTRAAVPAGIASDLRPPSTYAGGGGRLHLQNPRQRRHDRGFCMRRREDAHVPPRWPDVRPRGEARGSGPAPGRSARGRTWRGRRGGAEFRSCAALCKRLCKRSRRASKAARFTGLSIGSPAVPKLNVEGSIPFARFVRSWLPEQV